MQFSFSIRSNIKSAWDSFAQHHGLFLTLSAVMVVLQFSSRSHTYGLRGDVISLVVFIAALVWSYICIHITLHIIDGNAKKSAIELIRSSFPTMQQFLSLFAIAAICCLIVFCGLIILIVPGIYFIFRLTFSSFSYVDQHKGILASIRHSWAITHGDVIWTVILGCIIMLALVIVGLLLFGVGVLITYPIAFIFYAKLYRALSHFHDHHAKKDMVAPAESV